MKQTNFLWISAALTLSHVIEPGHCSGKAFFQHTSFNIFSYFDQYPEKILGSDKLTPQSRPLDPWARSLFPEVRIQ